MFKKSDIDGLSNMADFFSVSTLAILNRIRALGLIPYDVYTNLYSEEINKFDEISIYSNKEKGFAPPQKLVRSRNGDLFAFAVVDAVLNNKESYTNAVRLFDYKKFDIIEKVGKEFGILR